MGPEMCLRQAVLIIFGADDRMVPVQSLLAILCLTED